MSPGDGEPDRDFPALGAEKLLSDFNLDEYCICTVEGRKRASTGQGLRSTANTLTDQTNQGSVPLNNGSRGISGNFGGTIPHSNSASMLSSATQTFMGMNNIGGMSTHSGGGRNRDDTGNTLGRQDRTRSYSRQSYDSFQNSVSTVLVVFPDATQVVVPFKEDTLLLDLLPKISKLKRLRLYTNEYVFAVSAADQKHLKLMSPILDMQQPVCTIGATTLEIQNKYVLLSFCNFCGDQIYF